MKDVGEYIEREVLENWIRTEMASLDGEEDREFVIQRWRKEIPAADVRPVVTCGKCKYGKYTGTEWFCDKHSGHADKFGEDASYHEYHSKHWFCADGEEKNHA